MRFCKPQTRLATFWSFAMVVTILGSAAEVLRGQTNLEETSAAFAPADAGFFSMMLRTGEQWNRLMSSNAMATLRKNPFGQLGLGQLKQQWEAPSEDWMRHVKEAMETPENQELIELLRQAASTEIFCYGDSGVAKLVMVLNSFNRRVQSAQVEAMRNGDDPEEYIMHTMMDVFLERSDEIITPRIVIGMRIQDRPAAARQIARLASHAELLPQFAPQLQGRIRKHSLNGGEYVTLQVDGSMLPWEEMEETLGSDDELFDRFRSELVRKSISISIGVRGAYLLVALGPTDEQLAQIGTGANLLSVKEMSVVTKNAHRPLTSVSYADGRMLATFSEGQSANLADSLRSGLEAADLDEELIAKITERVSSLFEKLTSASMPKPGTRVAFEFMTDRGFEAYQHDWSENPLLDDSEPLTILRHVGGRPALMAAGHAKPVPDAYDQSGEFVRAMIDIANETALSMLEGDDKAKYEQARDAILPLLKRLDIANRELVGPAFGGGQSAVVVDFKLSSVQPHSMIPTSTTSLPLPELAIICSIRDGEKLKKGVAEYLIVAQAIADILHEVAPDEIPEVTIDRPIATQDAAGELFQYRLPADWGFEPELAPTGGLASDVVVFALSAETAKRVMRPTPLAMGGLLTDSNQKIAGAMYVDFPAIVDAATAWARYGFAAYTQGMDGPIDVSKSVLPVEDLLQVLKCYRGMTSVTYREGEAWVTHSEHVFEDLP